MNGLQTEFEDQIAFDAVDAATESGDMALDLYGLRGHPSYVIVDTKGEPLWSFSGQTTEMILQKFIVQYK